MNDDDLLFIYRVLTRGKCEINIFRRTVFVRSVDGERVTDYDLRAGTLRIITRAYYFVGGLFIVKNTNLFVFGIIVFS